jgi:hypothetical protein
MERSRRLKPLVLLEAALGAVAAALFLLAMSLNFADPAGGGESRIANAYAALAALVALWGILFILLLIDIARAGRLSWSALASLLLLPVAGVAGLLASDELHDLLARLCLPILPLLFGAFLLLPRDDAKPWGGRGRALALLSIAALSAYGLARSLW